MTAASTASLTRFTETAPPTAMSSLTDSVALTFSTSIRDDATTPTPSMGSSERASPASSPS